MKLEYIEGEKRYWTTRGSRMTVLDVKDLKTDEEKAAQAYYDSEDAFNFYKEVWGGDNLHVGIYDESVIAKQVPTKQDVADGAIKALDVLTSKVDIKADHVVMDMGSAYGGASRYLVQNFNCSVIGIDLSKKECERNIELTKAANMSEKIKVVCASFCETGEPDESIDVVISEDSFLHAGKFRGDTVKEAARVLKSGGYFVFSDIMQSDTGNPERLQQIFKRIHLDSMGSVNFYTEQAKLHGLEPVSFDDQTPQLIAHYSTINKVLMSRAEDIKGKVSAEYVANMSNGLIKWVEGGHNKDIVWGFFVFKKST